MQVAEATVRDYGMCRWLHFSALLAVMLTHGVARSAYWQAVGADMYDSHAHPLVSMLTPLLRRKSSVLILGTKPTLDNPTNAINKVLKKSQPCLKEFH